jgi:Lrp/AsnC family transcriptional regulator, regulator of ectoine-degradation genes
MKLDNRDLQILSILQQEGRITKSELAGRVSLSAAACWDRLKRLDQAGYIRGYHAEVALEKIAPASLFLVQIELESHQAADFQRFEEAMRAMPQVTRCVAVGGGVDYFLEIVARDVAAYQALVDDILERRIGVKRYFTFVVTKPVKSVPPPLDLLRANGAGES